MSRNALLIMLMTTTLSVQTVFADCLYKGQEYALFETVTEMDSAYTNDLNAQGYSADPYALVMECRPVLNLDEIQKGNFSVTRYPALNAVWVPSMYWMDASHVQFSANKTN